MDAFDKSSLPNDVESLKSLLIDQQQLLAEKDSCLKEKDKALQKKDQALQVKNKRISLLEEYIQLFKHKQFGRGSERHAGQSDLFNEAEVLNDIHQLEHSDDNLQAGTCRPHDKKQPKKARGRKRLPAHLERVKVYHELGGESSSCDCGQPMKAFDEIISEQLGVIPAWLYVIQHCRKKYSCPRCKNHVTTAPLPPQAIPKSNASPELLAHTLIAKFLDGLPFYRQEQIWKREGVQLPRATQANWSMQAGKLVIPLINLLKEHQQTGSVIHIDETPVQVLKEPDKPPDSKKYFWVTAGGPNTQQALIFHYDPSRGTGVARALLGDFKGTVISDDWHVYQRVCNELSLQHIACNDHARRKFKEAFISKKTTELADTALNYYQTLYLIERKGRDLSAEQRYQLRQTESKPVWAAFKGWVDEVLAQVPPTSKLGEALRYTHKLWGKLTAYCESGELPMSNQLAENAIRPFAIARKNFLFFDTPGGATASANHYSLIMSPKANGLDPFYYLAYIFKMLPAANCLEDYEALLPWRLNNEITKAAFRYVNRG